ncbi:MAG: ankyrin repeat domain-containing protein [Akkermansia sp.]|nr:ankyrin repeat domain-containing protein [Akkermansia sp.]
MENARRVLIEKGIPESEYNSYIGSAAENGDVELLSLLIAAGADINAEDSEGWAPFLLAYYEGHTECVRLLLAAPDINVNKEDAFGETLLCMECEHGHTEGVRLLLAVPGIDVNKVNNDGNAPLHGAAWNGYTECVRLLLSAPGIDVNMEDADGYTALYRAACAGHTECVRHLLGHPVSIQAILHLFLLLLLQMTEINFEACYQNRVLMSMKRTDMEWCRSAGLHGLATQSVCAFCCRYRESM